MTTKTLYEITFPDPDRPGEWKVIGEPMPREDAIAYLKQVYGIEDGLVTLLNMLPDDLLSSD